MNINTAVCLMALVALFAGCGNKNDDAPEPAPACQIVKNISYLPGDTSVRHMLDLYFRANGTPNDVIVFVPGGAWLQGDKSIYDTLGSTLARYYPYTVAVINYRLSNPDEGAAIHPDHVRDVAAAFRWIRDHVTGYGGDPGRIFLFGQSAGAHLAALLAIDEQYLLHEGCSLQDIRGVIAMSGAYRLPDLTAFPGNPLGLNAEEVVMYKAMMINAFGSSDSAVLFPASPAAWLNGEVPPFLLIHTELDMPGFGKEAENFHAQMTAFGGLSSEIFQLHQYDYSAETWATATAMAAEEPMLAACIGHYAEVVAINTRDRNKVPTPWIVEFMMTH